MLLICELLYNLDVLNGYPIHKDYKKRFFSRQLSPRSSVLLSCAQTPVFVYTESRDERRPVWRIPWLIRDVQDPVSHDDCSPVSHYLLLSFVADPKQCFSGQTNGNKFKVLHGQSDEPLNENGLLQAELVAAKLKADHFDLAFSSDLGRAFATASAIVQANESFNNINKITKDDLLRERHFGIFENRPYQEFVKMANDAGFTSVSGVWGEVSPDFDSVT